MTKSDRDRLPDGYARPKRVCLWLFVLSAVGLAYELVLHDYFQVVGYTVMTAGTACIYGVLEGMGHGYLGGYSEGHLDAEQSAAEIAEAEAARKLADETPREIVIDVTPPPPGEGFLYILKFSAGGVKVGQTMDLRRRLSEHRRGAEAYGVVITDYWVSPAHANYLDNEIELIGFCDGISATRAKREYFHGIEYRDVVRFAAKSLIYYSRNAAITEVNR